MLNHMEVQIFTTGSTDHEHKIKRINCVILIKTTSYKMLRKEASILQ